MIELDLDNASVDDVIREYICIRNMLAAERKTFSQLEGVLKSDMEQLSMWLRDLGDKIGTDQFKTKGGVAYRSENKSYRVGNWDDVLDYIKETGNWQMLEKRIGKNATKEIHDETGKIPPGVDFSLEVDFKVRKG